MQSLRESNCTTCQGTGKVRYDIPSSSSRTFADGTVITDMGGSGTRACDCIRDMPAVHGRATWWEAESVHSAEVDIPIGSETVEISVVREVPRGENGRRLHRTVANSYWPTLVDMVVEGHKATMHFDTARELGQALIAAADACEKADVPFPDVHPDQMEMA